MNLVQAFNRARHYHQAGALLPAIAIYRQILEQDPTNVPALFHLGGACQGVGDFAEAVACYQKLLRLQPAQAEVHYQIGVSFHNQNSLAEAAAAYRRAVELRPDHAEAHNNLGVILEGQGQWEQAAACYQEALRLRPDYADAHNNLGVVFNRQGRFQEAAACYQRAISARPRYAQAHSNLGNALRQLGLRKEAIACYQEALRLQPNYADAHYNLGVVLMEEGRQIEAEAAFREALRLRPAFLEAHHSLGLVLHRQRRLPEATAAYRQALQLRPDFTEAAFSLANAFREQGQVEEAVATYRRILQSRPDMAEVHHNLANTLEEQGNLQDCLAHVLEAARLRPDWAYPLFTLAELACHGHYQISDDQVQRIQALLADPQLPLNDASLAHFAQAFLFDKAGDHDRAFASYRTGNACKHRLLQQTGEAFDPAAHQEAIDQLIAAYDRPFFERTRDFGLDSQLPLLIVGMPRSGTTLIEQILSRHPAVFAAGELKELGRLVAELPARLGGAQPHPQCIAGLTAEVARGLAEDYCRQLARRGGPAARVTDKMPLNYLNLGLLAAVLPRARVIHCRRHPADTCLSCYFQYFRELNFTWDLEDLGRYYRGYQRLMDHWRSVLPVPPLEVSYEDLVADQEAVSRRMVAYCGLDWDDRCLDFHASTRTIQTMSKLQVRRPIYSTSVGRWKRYEAHLQPLLAALQEP